MRWTIIYSIKNFKRVGIANQFKSIYKILKSGERGSKKNKRVKRPWLNRGS